MPKTYRLLFPLNLNNVNQSDIFLGRKKGSQFPHVTNIVEEIERSFYSN